MLVGPLGQPGGDTRTTLTPLCLRRRFHPGPEAEGRPGCARRIAGRWEPRREEACREANCASRQRRWGICRPARVGNERCCPEVEQARCHQAMVAPAIKLTRWRSDGVAFHTPGYACRTSPRLANRFAVRSAADGETYVMNGLSCPACESARLNTCRSVVASRLAFPPEQCPYTSVNAAHQEATQCRKECVSHFAWRLRAR